MSQEWLSSVPGRVLLGGAVLDSLLEDATVQSNASKCVLTSCWLGCSLRAAWASMGCCLGLFGRCSAGLSAGASGEDSEPQSENGRSEAGTGQERGHGAQRAPGCGRPITHQVSTAPLPPAPPGLRMQCHALLRPTVLRTQSLSLSLPLSWKGTERRKKLLAVK